MGVRVRVGIVSGCKVDFLTGTMKPSFGRTVQLQSPAVVQLCKCGGTALQPLAIIPQAELFAVGPGARDCPDL